MPLEARVLIPMYIFLVSGQINFADYESTVFDSFAMNINSFLDCWQRDCLTSCTYGTIFE
jgi:hypothetical protein